MTQSPDMAPLGSRAHGMWQFLMSQRAQNQTPMVGPDRGIVSQDDAADALLMIAATIDEQMQYHGFPVDKAFHVFSMLMIARDYVRPLPTTVEEGPDLLDDDLRELVGNLAIVRDM